MPKLKGILLDLDGTLANTEDYSYLYTKTQKTEDLLEYKLYQFFKPILKVIPWEEFIELYIRSQKEIKAELSGTAAAHNRYLYIQRTLEHCGINFVPDIIQRGVDFYFEEMLKKTELYPGVLQLLKMAKYNQLATCIVTDFTADIQIKKIRKLGIMRYIDYMVTSEEAGADKPHIEQGVLALKKLHLRQDEVIMVGNNPKTDIELAYHLGLRSVLFDPRKLYEGVKGKETFYTQNFSEITKILGIKERIFSHKELLIIDFIGTLTTEKQLIEEVLGAFIHKESAYISAEYQLFRQGKIKEAEFWYRLGVGDMKKAHRAIDAAVTIRRSVVSLLKRLKRKYTLVLLTDFPGQWGRSILENRGVSKYFKLMVFGNDTEFAKPDVRLFSYVLSQFPAMNPELVTVVDDTLDALAAGRSLLMKTILVENEKSQHSVFAPDGVVKDILGLEIELENGTKINK